VPESHFLTQTQCHPGTPPQAAGAATEPRQWPCTCARAYLLLHLLGPAPGAPPSMPQDPRSPRSGIVEPRRPPPPHAAAPASPPTADNQGHSAPAAGLALRSPVMAADTAPPRRPRLSAPRPTGSGDHRPLAGLDALPLPAKSRPAATATQPPALNPALN
jgi:hypothetical protein